MAEAVGKDLLQLPAPEMCRAILITGRIGPVVTGETTNYFRELDRDFDQLLNVIAMNNGWVAEIYLASDGGIVGTGIRLGQLVRTFWLKGTSNYDLFSVRLTTPC